MVSESCMSSRAIGEEGHGKCTSILCWTEEVRGIWRSIDSYQMKYTGLEICIMYDALQYRLHVKTLS